ncbi:MAG: glycosyltransferase family 39 protein, partial [Planctomycetota bacterium]
MALGADGRPGVIAWGLVAVAAGLLWIPPLQAGLTQDEVFVWWLAKDGLGKLVRHMALDLAPPLHAFLASAAMSVLGTSDVALRVPSLVAAVVATILVYRIGARVRDAETGWLAAVAFVGSSDLAYAASDARPYALAVAFVAAATLCLLEWAERPRASLGVLYGVLAALAFHAHYVIAVALVAHPIHLAARRREGLGPR